MHYLLAEMRLERPERHKRFFSSGAALAATPVARDAGSPATGYGDGASRLDLEGGLDLDGAALGNDLEGARALADHTYTQRVALLQQVLDGIER